MKATEAVAILAILTGFTLTTLVNGHGYSITWKDVLFGPLNGTKPWSVLVDDMFNFNELEVTTTNEFADMVKASEQFFMTDVFPQYRESGVSQMNTWVARKLPRVLEKNQTELLPELAWKCSDGMYMILKELGWDWMQSHIYDLVLNSWKLTPAVVNRIEYLGLMFMSFHEMLTEIHSHMALSWIRKSSYPKRRHLRDKFFYASNGSLDDFRLTAVYRARKRLMPDDPPFPWEVNETFGEFGIGDIDWDDLHTSPKPYHIITTTTTTPKPSTSPRWKGWDAVFQRDSFKPVSIGDDDNYLDGWKMYGRWFDEERMRKKKPAAPKVEWYQKRSTWIVAICVLSVLTVIGVPLCLLCRLRCRRRRGHISLSMRRRIQPRQRRMSNEDIEMQEVRLKKVTKLN